MKCVRIRALGFLSLAASLLAFAACDPDGGAGPGPVTAGPVSLSVLPIRHLHMATAGFDAEPRDDLPERIMITLNGIPGAMGGMPAEGHDWNQDIASSAELRVNWDSLMAGGHLGAPAAYSGTQPFQTVSPASTDMMRIGTFAAGEDDESVYPDSAFEGYGLYSLKYLAPVVAVYFDRPAELKGISALCDGTPVRADISLPKAGFYLFMSRFDGSLYYFSPLPDTSDLVFAVTTASDAYLEFARELANRAVCDGSLP